MARERLTDFWTACIMVLNISSIDAFWPWLGNTDAVEPGVNAENRPDGGMLVVEKEWVVGQKE